MVGISFNETKLSESKKLRTIRKFFILCKSSDFPIDLFHSPILDDEV
jgi:hypothetical protein